MNHRGDEVRFCSRFTVVRSSSFFLALILFLGNSVPAGAQKYLILTHELTLRSAFALDASKSATVDGKTFHVLDLKSSKEIQLIKGHEFQVYVTVFSRDGTRILAGDGNSFRLWDVKSGKQIMQIKGRNGNLSCLAITPDERFAISGHSSGAGAESKVPFDLLLWDLRTGKEIFDKGGCRFAGQKEVNCIAISPDSKQVICGRKDGTARLLEISTGKEIQCIQPKMGSIHSVAFSPDGENVLIGEETGNAFLWRIGEATERYRLHGHEGAVYSVAFSPSGHQAITGAADKTAKLWDLQTGIELAKYQELESAVTSSVFSPDSKSAFLADGWGKWKRWNLPK